MPRPRLAILFALPGLACGCVVSVPVPETTYSACHATGAGDWTARVERIPDHHNRPVYKPILIVTGKLVVPNENYSVSLDLGPVQNLDEPVQQILVRTIPPDGAAPGPPATIAVEGRFPARKRYGALAIRCGDGILAIVKSIPREGDQPKVKSKAGRRTRTSPAMPVTQTRVRATGIPAA
jgi:hypothetical protein